MIRIDPPDPRRPAAFFRPRSGSLTGDRHARLSGLLFPLARPRPPRASGVPVPSGKLREEILIGADAIRGGRGRAGTRLAEGAKPSAHGLGVAGQSHRLRPTDHPGLVQLDQVLVEGLHPALTALDVKAQILETFLQDRLGRIHPPAEDLDGGTELAIPRLGE